MIQDPYRILCTLIENALCCSSFIYFFRLYVVLNSDRTIREAFVKRQEEFSHRAEEFYFKVSGLKDGKCYTCIIIPCLSLHCPRYAVI